MILHYEISLRKGRTLMAKQTTDSFPEEREEIILLEIINQSINHLIFYTCLFLIRVTWSAGANPSALRREAGIHPRWSPANRGAHTPFTHTFTPTGNLESPINLSMFLDCGRKPEYPVKTHADTGRTCKLHTERSQTQDQGGLEPATFLL